MGDDQVFAGTNNDQPSFWIDGDGPNCFPNHVATPQMTIVNGEVTSSECDPAFCIYITSSADPDLCEHPKAGPSAWKGNPVDIFQNGNKVGSMPTGTKQFRFCLDYDQVDTENDIFTLAKSGDDGVCITSLSVDGNDILVGPNGAQPNFWIDGDDNDCTDDFVSTDELLIQNNAVISSECDPKFCIEMTSSADEDLCQHIKGGPKDYPGGPISIKQNGNVIGSMKKGTQNFKLCLDYDQVDISNDVFELHNPKNDGVCVTSLTVDGNAILFGPNDQPNFWLDGDDNDCRGDFVSTQTLTIQNNALASSECDPKFCIEMTSTRDEDLCLHPMGGPKDYKGHPIIIKQNGNTIGTMGKGVEDFRLCIDYDQVDLDDDVFTFSNPKSDGVCITSLTVDGNAVLVGNDQPNFWLDGDFEACTPSSIITSELTVVGGEATSIDGCTDFCINVTSGENQGLCDHPKWPNAWENWSGGDVAVNYNGNQVATMERGFEDFEFCLPRWSVDVENDEFQLSTPHTKGVCVTSFTVDGQPILVGPNNDLSSFWLDNNVDCLDQFVATTQITVKNGQVSSSYCDNDLYCIKVTSGLDLEKCHHPGWPDAAANDWAGDDVFLYRNGQKVIGSLFPGFTEYEYCWIRSEIDVANDKFKLYTRNTDGICVTSLTIDNEPVLAGRNKDLASFWIDDNVECRDDFMASRHVTIQNGEVISDYCN